MTVRLEAVGEMDPGLKLIIQRRQVRRLAIQHPYITIDVIYFVIESVDSISRDGPDTLIYIIHYKKRNNSKEVKFKAFKL